MWSSPLFSMRMCLARRKMGRLESAITSFPNRTNKIKPVLIFHPWFSTSEDVFQTLIQVLKEQKDDYCHGRWWNSPIKYSTLRRHWDLMCFDLSLSRLLSSFAFIMTDVNLHGTLMLWWLLLERSTSVEDLDGMDGRGWGEDDFTAVTDGDSVGFVVTGSPGL